VLSRHGFQDDIQDKSYLNVLTFALWFFPCSSDFTTSALLEAPTHTARNAMTFNKNSSLYKQFSRRNHRGSKLQPMPLDRLEERDARQRTYENMSAAQQAYEDLCWERPNTRSIEQQ